MIFAIKSQLNTMLNYLKSLTKYLKLENLWQLGLLLYLFLLPWQTRWIFSPEKLNNQIIDYWSMSLYATDILLLVVILFYFVFKNKKATKLPVDLGSLLIITLAGLFITLYWASDRSLTFFYFLQFSKGTVLLLLLLKTNFTRAKIIWPLLLAGTGQAILAILQFIWQKIPQVTWLGLHERLPEQLGVTVIDNGERILRAYGAFDSPNVLGGFLALSIILALPLFFQNKSQKQKIFLIFLYILNTAGIFFSFSRSAALALIAGLATLIIFSLLFKKEKAKIKNLTTILSGILIILLALTLIFSNLTFSRLNLENRLEERSVTDRIDQSQQALKIIKQNWQFGTGLGNYQRTLSKLTPGLAAYDYQPVHNTYLLMVAELGAFVSFIILIFLIYIFYQNRKNIFALSLLVSILVLLAFDHYLWTGAFGIILLWIILALTLKTKS